MNLSLHFSLDEFYAHSGTAQKLGIDNTPPDDVIPNLTRLAGELEKVRALTGQPLNILSGYRCPELNKAVGGVPTSFHQFGCAADIHPPEGMTFQDFKDAISGTGAIVFDLLLEESAGDGGHWLHFQIPKPGTPARRLVKDAYLDHTGGAITRVTVG